MNERSQQRGNLKDEGYTNKKQYSRIFIMITRRDIGNNNGNNGNIKKLFSDIRRINLNTLHVPIQTNIPNVTSPTMAINPPQKEKPYFKGCSIQRIEFYDTNHACQRYNQEAKKAIYGWHKK
ncbi:hypothetical protein ID855_14705 [Xenorhabdus sp. ZM]|uniref:hypothetical protein n=2 Tax=Xenorhabdus szentirmaii TaxID=290112 RepID=UPI0019C2B309|nr:hypothetical protein [Xenorhabdus sp. ZM]MBD2805925.1 hypothetical protein [Xenorhabdus sp. ZM]